MNKPVIQLTNLSKSYDGMKAIDGLSMEIPEGSVFGLVGPNGAGKSTLIQMIMGIIKPDEGDIQVCGQDIQVYGQFIRQKIGYVPDVSCMYPSFTAKDMFSLGNRLYENWDWNRCRELSASFEIPLDKRIRTLSRGGKLRLATVMALSVSPELLVLDEPTAGLDPIIRKEFLQAVIDESAVRGTTVFYSTHNLNDLERTADHIAALNEGKMVFNLSLDDIKEEYHCLQVVLDDDTDYNQLAALSEMIESSGSGKIRQLIMQGNIKQIEEQVNLLNPRHMEICDLSLEDIFISLMKNKRCQDHHTA